MKAWFLFFIGAAAAVIACLGGCSRTRSVETPSVELEPMPHADRIYVTFPAHESRDGTPHYVTDPIVIGRIENLANAERAGWRDIRSWGKYPIARAELTLYSGNNISTLELGNGYLLRRPMLQNVPYERTRELMELLGGKVSDEAHRIP
jgi:hypothetical protein